MGRKKKPPKYSLKNLIIADQATQWLLEENALPKSSLVVASRGDFVVKILATRYTIQNIIVLVELEWNNLVGQFLGYELASELLNHPNRESPFNLIFFSTLPREEILFLNQTTNIVFTKKYPHVRITTKFDINELIGSYSRPPSTRKFNYLRHYCVLQVGILDRLIHDAGRLLNTKDLEAQAYFQFLKELRIHKSILNEELDKLLQAGLAASPQAYRMYLLEIKDVLLKLYRKQHPTGPKKEKRLLPYRVMIIEDNERVAEELAERFRQLYQRVVVYNSGSDAYQELQANAWEYDVVVTDLELLEGYFDDQVQGVDILELCEEEYPYLAVRLVTGLPRFAVQQLTGKQGYEILYKDNARQHIAWFDGANDYFASIKQELAWRPKMRNIPGPSATSWKMLTRQLHEERVRLEDKGQSRWQRVYDRVNAFTRGEFDQLPEEKKVSVSFSKLVYGPQWKDIDHLLTHRLIALAFAQAHAWGRFTFFGEGPDAYNQQSGLQEGLTANRKNYFNTFLGLSGEGNMHGATVYKITYNEKEFFPEELVWLREPDNRSFYFIKELPGLYDVVDELSNLLEIYAAIYEAPKIRYADLLQFLEQVAAKINHDTTIPRVKRCQKILHTYREEEDREYQNLPSSLKQLVRTIQGEIDRLIR